MTVNKYACESDVARARRGGWLEQASSCEACGKTREPGDHAGAFHWHHWSYDTKHALDVIEVCLRCHFKIHSGEIPEPRTGRVYKGGFWRKAKLRCDIRRFMLASGCGWVSSKDVTIALGLDPGDVPSVGSALSALVRDGEIMDNGKPKLGRKYARALRLAAQ